MMFKPHILALYLGISPVALATLPEGITAGIQNIALGEGSFASGTSSQAVGQGAVATGGNITPEAFAQAYAQYTDLIAQINNLRQEIAGVERQQGIKQLEEQDIQQQLTQLETLIAAAQLKLDKQAEIALQKQGQETLRQQMQGELDTLQQTFNSNSFNVPGDKKTVYNNFISVLNALDWEKLKQAGGRDALVQDLKTGIERDFGSSVNFPIEKYNQLIDGYINIQGNITFLEEPFKQRLFNDFKSGSFRNTLLSNTGLGVGHYYENPTSYSYVGFGEHYLLQEGIRVDRRDESADELLSRVVDPKQGDFSGRPTFDLPNPPMGTPEEEEWLRLEREWNQKVYRPWYNTHIAPLDMGNSLAKSALQRTVRLLAADSTSKVAKLLAQYNSRPANLGSSSILSLLLAPVLTRSLNTSEASMVVDAFLVRNGGSLFENSSSSAISLADLQRLEVWHQGQRTLLSLVDYNSDDWLFDKEEHRQFVEDKVKPFLTKVEQFTRTMRRLEDTSLTQEERDAIAAEVIEQRKQLALIYKEPQNYLTGFRPTKWIDESLKNLMVESRDLMLAYQDEAVRTLLPYSSTDSLILAAKLAVDQQLQALADKQTAITQVDNQIAALQAEWDSYRLTLDEQEAATQKVEWERRLADKQQELQALADQLKTQRDTLLGLNTQVDNSPLGGQGQNAIAQGTDAFASGADSMAIGTKALAIGDKSIAQGAEAVAKGEHSIALGTQAQALKARAIAIGHQAIANAEGAVAMGDRAGVGEKGINAIAIGTESLVDAENAVGIGTRVKVTGKDAVAVGAASIVTGNQAVSVGANNTVTGNTAVSIGSGNQVLHDKAIAIGANITETAANSVNLGHESVAVVTPNEQTAGMASYAYSPLLSEVYQFAASQPAGVVTIGAKGSERRLQNVAAGFIAPTSTDAINGSQLYSVIKAVDEGQIGIVRQDRKTGEIGIATHLSGSVVNISNNQGMARQLSGVADGVAPTDAVNMRQFNREVGRLDGRVDKVERDVKSIKGSVANAVAMASMPAASMPGQSLLSIGTGHAVNTAAVAVGYSHMSDSGKVSYKLNSSLSNRGSFAVGAGVGFAW
ncbi:YadA-like family protein [Pelistega suis]|uniref:Trimeric autotransporter adhesin YadA-like C-terminal membrane anchor domain-containing protein n=1 Tax=Pelistega suis TaxID=1631957 RepID=A0A849P1A6_9BURK|nr:YadA-like family protein [Pelistega suis]NOL51180.1 hypothetical protein [Pelistega suis]